MRVSKGVMIALLTVLPLSFVFTSVSAQSTIRETPPSTGGIVLVTPPLPEHKKSDCNKNGIDDLDEFYPPDCWKAP